MTTTTNSKVEAARAVWTAAWEKYNAAVKAADWRKAERAQGEILRAAKLCDALERVAD